MTLVKSRQAFDFYRNFRHEANQGKQWISAASHRRKEMLARHVGGLVLLNLNANHYQ
jgi:hypothetical protein